MKYYIYMIRCVDHSLYTGITTDVQRRYQQHVSGVGAKYTRAHKPQLLEAYWSCSDKSLASKMEYYLKKLNKQQKEDIIKDDNYLNIYHLDQLDLVAYKREL